jgi:hypothetical protein
MEMPCFEKASGAVLSIPWFYYVFCCRHLACILFMWMSLACAWVEYQAPWEDSRPPDESALKHQPISFRQICMLSDGSESATDVLNKWFNMLVFV